MAKVKIGNVKGPQGEQGPQGPTGATGATGQVDASTAIEFEENSSYANIESGESIATIFGKLKKIVGGILAGAGSTLLGANLTADRVLLSNSDGKITASTITAAELAYLDGLTGNVQKSINSLTENKLDKNYIETTVTTDSAGRAEISYKADKIINCTVADGRYVAIPRFLSREKKSCLVYLYTVDDLKKVPNTTVVLQIRYID